MDINAAERHSEQIYKLNNSLHGDVVLAKLNEQRTAGTYTDVVLCVNNCEFPVHRNVLAASSPYFNAMFTSHLRESHESKISFNDMAPRILSRIIDYVYTGVLSITKDNAQELLAAGNLLEYPVIVKACCDFLTNEIHSTNCLGIENIAALHLCEELRAAATKYAHDNFSLVVDSEEFLDITKDRLVGFISDDWIDVPNEEAVYEAVMTWIRHDPKSRQKHIYELLKLVRLSNIDSDFLQSIINNEITLMNEKCIELINDTLSQKQSGYDFGKRRRSKQMLNTCPRPSTIAKEVIVAVGGNDINLAQTVEFYDIHKNKWSYLCDLPQSTVWHSVVAIDNCIILSGGMLNGCISSAVWKYDACSRMWCPAAPMVQPRAKHASVAHNGCVYVMGGVSFNGHITDTDSIDCYNCDTDSWTTVGKTILPRKQSRLIVNCDQFAEVGGLQSDAKVNTIEVYDNASIDHSIESSGEQYLLPEPIQFSQILVLNGIYYIFWEDTKKVLTLNPSRRMFRMLPEMGYSHIHSGATVFHNKLFIVGGLSDSKPSKTVECYDPLTNKWTIERPMNYPRAGHGCVTLVL